MTVNSTTMRGDMLDLNQKTTLLAGNAIMLGLCEHHVATVY